MPSGRDDTTLLQNRIADAWTGSGVKKIEDAFKTIQP
jgi:hypothetical protein